MTRYRDIDELLANMSPDVRVQADAQPERTKANKYRNTPTHVDGIRFDSKAEARRYHQLTAMLESGEITDLRLQPEYTLQEAYTTTGGDRVRAIRYRADFSYVRNGKVVVEDVKGMQTKEFRLKAKLLAERYPHVRLEIVK